VGGVEGVRSPQRTAGRHRSLSRTSLRHEWPSAAGSGGAGQQLPAGSSGGGVKFALDSAAARLGSGSGMMRGGGGGGADGQGGGGSNRGVSPPPGSGAGGGSARPMRGQRVAYEVTTLTSDIRGAGTDCGVSVVVVGRGGDSGELLLENHPDNFARGRYDTFVVMAPTVSVHCVCTVCVLCVCV